MRGIQGEPGAREGTRPHLHPARRPRAERVDLDRAAVRLVGHQPLRRDRGRRGLPLGPCARRCQRSGTQHAGRHPEGRRRRAHRRVHQAGQGQELERQADGLRAPRLQELRPARQADAGNLQRSAGRARPRERSALQAGHGAREDRPGRRVLRQPQALPERGLLLGHRAARHRHSGAAFHGHLRARPHGRLDRATERDDRRPGLQDRPSSPALHRRYPARRTGHRQALIASRRFPAKAAFGQLFCVLADTATLRSHLGFVAEGFSKLSTSTY
ncbi:Citrate synthase (modular protein) [Burkholderiales bacterium 8X]|nr:Citrate synthase (modular protein) [Burkholderiales bacterium 8X]